MNKDNAKDYLPLVQALAEGKTIQFREDEDDTFDDIDDEHFFDDDVAKYRIKPEPKKQSCRMYLVKSTTAKTGKPFYTAIASNSNVSEIDDIESSPIFVRWLTDRIEFELPE